MMREVMWTPWRGPGLEHLRLLQEGDGALADGLILGTAHGVPFRLRYGLRLDAGWRARDVALELIEPARPGRRLRGDGEGRWRDGDGAALPELDGCLDVDLSCSPMTNTLPVRRLALGVGETRELAMAYVALPELAVSAVRQRYTRTGQRRWLFETLPPAFRAELEVDADGLVLDYPQLFRRVWPAR